MEIAELMQYLALVSLVLLAVKPVGYYMACVYECAPTVLDRFLNPVERCIYRLAGVDPAKQMTARQYALSFVFFSLAGTVLLYAILRLQALLPWFYTRLMSTAMTPDLAFNTAISFATTTTWQAYAGETTMSYFSQMAGLCAQNFLAAAAGLSVGVAFLRGMARNYTQELGNFWQDLTRSLLWILLPLSLVGSLVLVGRACP